jgi:hypothetical protein
MQWQLQLTEDRSRLSVTAWGPAQVDALMALLVRATEPPDWRPGIHVLLDFRALAISALTMADIRQLADHHRPYGKILAASRIAVVVSRPVDFGLVRMWGTLVHDLNLTHEVFYGEAEALHWLHASDPMP